MNVMDTLRRVVHRARARAPRWRGLGAIRRIGPEAGPRWRETPVVPLRRFRLDPHHRGPRAA